MVPPQYFLLKIIIIFFLKIHQLFDMESQQNMNACCPHCE